MYRPLVYYLLAFAIVLVSSTDGVLSPDDYLSLGDSALAAEANTRAIELYESGIVALGEKDDGPSSSTFLTMLSLETNLATAYSAIGKTKEAIEHYRNAIVTYSKVIESIEDTQVTLDATDIVSQASFFLGMVFQDDTRNSQRAVEAYGYAVVLDPLHWAAWANLGSVLHDQLSNYDDALDAYNKAYLVLTESDHPTDPPAEPRFILSQLQYRIGLCLNHDPNRKCAIHDDPDQAVVSCREMATHAFSLAVQYDSDNESAKHMLATVTADATMKRASNHYVKSLFDDYAQNFEHSLVQELGYNGYERLRRGFDRAFGGSQFVPTFPLVIDAGCGTGLVGKQFRNISSHLIGVDLSQAILDEAERLRPKLYDERITGDVTEVFRNKKPISLIVAADSYIYFGDLDPLFSSMQDGLDMDAYLAFTLENVDAENESTLEESKPDWRWQLTPSGRFAHRKEYVVSVGIAHGLHVVHYERLDGFRHELGKDVRGHLFVMRKTVKYHDDL